MATLLPGQFELSGLVFGRAEDPITVMMGGWKRGSYEVRDQDAPSPVGDNLLVGRDRLTPETWSWELAIHDEVNARPHIAALARVWRADATRTTPGATLALRYNEHGVTYVVYGRPRKLGWVEDEVSDPTWRTALATFQITDPNVYSDALQQLTLNLVSTNTNTSGLILPAVLPWDMGETASSQRKGLVYVAGYSSTPVRVTINGPLSGTARDVVLSAPDWRIALSAPVASGDVVEIDTATGTMTWNGSPSSALTRDSSLGFRLPPGNTEVTLTASDSTATLAATLAWRTAEPLI